MLSPFTYAKNLEKKTNIENRIFVLGFSKNNFQSLSLTYTFFENKLHHYKLYIFVLKKL